MPESHMRSNAQGEAVDMDICLKSMGAGNVNQRPNIFSAQQNSISRNLKDSRQLLLFSSNF
jgi:hypothetical protein